ncbi:DUF6122 family protein [Pseudotenacibaculum sp. MALMAid0570]|uniref:DUF6122 family protein n=1 Tax=Pseudotenacibaculum sp. MALMAid0570 TaxID=3143938 RepID=UPI0032E002E1
MLEVKFIIHYSLHFLVPLGLAILLFKSKWKQVYLIFLLTMLVDLDHLIANPIYNPNRCSINFHPLHSYYAIALYLFLLFFKKTRVVAIGLLMHMIADGIDCFL